MFESLGIESIIKGENGRETLGDAGREFLGELDMEVRGESDNATLGDNGLDILGDSGLLLGELLCELVVETRWLVCKFKQGLDPRNVEKLLVALALLGLVSDGDPDGSDRGLSASLDAALFTRGRRDRTAFTSVALHSSDWVLLGTSCALRRP